MQINPVKTQKIVPGEDRDLFKILDLYLPELKDNTVLAVTSKIVGICEGRFVKIEEDNKDELIKAESQFFLPRSINKYNVSFTITNNLLVASAGIDESNGDGYYILWPENPQQSANKIREFLSKKFSLKNFGVIITDSKTTPLKWGVTGMAITHSGFVALKDYIGKPDLFGREFVFEKLNMADSLAASAVLVMGEGSEQTPLATITDIPSIEFQDRNPTEKELESIRINLKEDLFAPFLDAVNWQKGQKND